MSEIDDNALVAQVLYSYLSNNTVAPNELSAVIDTVKRVLNSATDIAVGTLISEHPPHRTVRAEFPHTAPTSDV